MNTMILSLMRARGVTDHVYAGSLTHNNNGVRDPCANPPHSDIPILKCPISGIESWAACKRAWLGIINWARARQIDDWVDKQSGCHDYTYIHIYIRTVCVYIAPRLRVAKLRSVFNGCIEIFGFLNSFFLFRFLSCLFYNLKEKSGTEDYDENHQDCFLNIMNDPSGNFKL